MASHTAVPGVDAKSMWYWAIAWVRVTPPEFINGIATPFKNMGGGATFDYGQKLVIGKTPTRFAGVTEICTVTFCVHEECSGQLIGVMVAIISWPGKRHHFVPLRDKLRRNTSSGDYLPTGSRFQIRSYQNPYVAELNIQHQAIKLRALGVGKKVFSESVRHWLHPGRAQTTGPRTLRRHQIPRMFQTR